MGVIEAMRAFAQGHGGADALFRALIEHEPWFVPVDPVGRPALFQVEGALHLVASVRPEAPGNRTHEWREVAVAHLIRHLPVEAAGVVFEPLHDHALVICGSSLDSARHWAAVTVLEQALETPGPGQASAFLDHEWLVLGETDGVHRTPVAAAFHAMRAVHAFTATDHLREFLAAEPGYRSMTALNWRGADLFATLDARDDFDCVVLNRHPSRAAHTLAPGAVHQFAGGREGRPSAQVLAAQTVAEIHLFLDLHGIAHDDRRHALVHRGDRLVALYEGTRFGGGLEQFLFEPVMPGADPQALGEAPSDILCAGVLAETLRRRERALPTDPAAVDARQRALAAEGIRWTQALLRFVPEAGQRIARAALRTEQGAWWARETPQMLTHEWVDAMGLRMRALAGLP